MHYFIKLHRGSNYFEVKEISKSHFDDILEERIKPVGLVCVAKLSLAKHTEWEPCGLVQYHSSSQIGQTEKAHIYKEVCAILNIRMRAIPVTQRTIGVEVAPFSGLSWLDKYKR